MKVKVKWNEITAYEGEFEVTSIDDGSVETAIETCGKSCRITATYDREVTDVEVVGQATPEGFSVSTLRASLEKEADMEQFDPDAVLDDILNTPKQIEGLEFEAYLYAMEDAMAKMRALDAHLSAGGALPSPWTPAGVAEQKRLDAVVAEFKGDDPWGQGPDSLLGRVVA